MGQGPLTVEEKRRFLARVVRARPEETGDDSDLWQEICVTGSSVKRKLPDKLRAIAQDNDLAGDGAEAGAALSVVEALRAITHGTRKA